MDELLQQAVAHSVGDDLLLLLGARGDDGVGDGAVVAPRDGAGEEGEFVVGDAGDFVGVLSHARLVGVDNGEPELGVVPLELLRDLAVQAVVVEDDVEVRFPAGGVFPDGDVAAVRVAVEWGTLAEDHLVENAGQRCGYLVPVYAVGVDVFEIVRPVTGEVFHDENTLHSPHDVGYDQGCVVDVLKVLSSLDRVLPFLREVQLLR